MIWSLQTRRLRALALVGLACVCSTLKGASGQTQTTVALELVLAIDTSTSVDAQEFLLQRDGLALAFQHPQVQAAIKTLGAKGMAVSVVAWAGQGQQANVTGWQRIAGTASAMRFADAIRRIKRPFKGFTDIAGGLEFSSQELLSNAFAGERMKVDVSGDGTSDFEDPSRARDAAVAQGVTINGLAIHSEEYDLGTLARIDLQQHFTQKVIGGEGAFFMEIESFQDFADAIRRKLVREIAGDAFANRIEPDFSKRIVSGNFATRISNRVSPLYDTLEISQGPFHVRR